MAFSEREKSERESLIFTNQEKAGQFLEKAGEKLSRERGQLQREREVVGEIIQDEFVSAGEAASELSKPWEHSEEEHEEVQTLANLAFSRDLKSALTRAKQSQNYPRNIDLLHDVLTGELYDAVREYRMNKQKWGGWLAIAIGIVLVVGVIILLIISL